MGPPRPTRKIEFTGTTPSEEEQRTAYELEFGPGTWKDGKTPEQRDREKLQKAKDYLNKKAQADLEAKGLVVPDVTSKVLRDARSAEFSRNRGKRGRKSMFLVDSGWEDSMGALGGGGY